MAAIGKKVLLPLPGGPATTIMTGRAGFDAATAGSAGFDARQRCRTHVGRQLARNEPPIGINHPHLFQSLACLPDPALGQRVHARVPSRGVGVVVEVEVVDAGFRDQRLISGATHHDNFIIRRPERRRQCTAEPGVSGTGAGFG